MYALLLVVLMSTIVSLRATVFPMGGRQMHDHVPGRVMQIGWNDDLEAQFVDIGLWDGKSGQLTMIARRVDASAGTYAWSVPTEFSYGERYRIMVRDSDAPLRAEYSKGFLTIGVRPRPVVASVSDVDLADDVRVDPFPASERVTVSWRDRSVVRMEMYDLQRRPVVTMSVDPAADRTSVDIRDVAAGLYYIKLTHVGGNVVVVPAMIGR